MNQKRIVIDCHRGGLQNSFKVNNPLMPDPEAVAKLKRLSHDTNFSKQVLLEQVEKEEIV